MKRMMIGGIGVDRRLCVDELNIGAKHIINRLPKLTIGNGAANNAVATRALAPQHEIVLFAQVGDDETGRRVRQEMQSAHNIAMPLAPCVNSPTSESFIVAEAMKAGRGTIVTVPGARALELPLQRIFDELRNCEACSLCGPSTNSQIANLVQAAARADVPVYFPLGSTQISGLSVEQLEQSIVVPIELVICNTREASRLTGTDDIETQLRILQLNGRSRYAVVTCGEEGLWGMDQVDSVFQPAYRDKNRRIVDDTAAGDATAAAIIDALCRGKPFDEALACGARNGFEACTGIGLDCICDETMMEQYLEARNRNAA